jgi:hypothetical protein
MRFQVHMKNGEVHKSSFGWSGQDKEDMNYFKRLVDDGIDCKVSFNSKNGKVTVRTGDVEYVEIR